MNANVECEEWLKIYWESDECAQSELSDILCTAYLAGMARQKELESIRLEILESIAEAWLKDHQELKNFTSGFGPKQKCECSVCKKVRSVIISHSNACA